MKRAKLLVFRDVTVESSSISYRFQIDSAEKCFTLDMPARNDLAGISPYFAAVGCLGMAYLIDLIGITLPKVVEVQPYRFSAKAELFWKETAFRLSCERVLADGVPIHSIRNIKWSFCGSQDLVPISCDRAMGSRRKHYLLGMSGGKDSLLMFELVRRTSEQYSLFFLKDRPRYWKTVQPSLHYFQGLDVPCHVARHNAGDVHDLMSDYHCTSFSRFIVGHLFFAASIIAYKHPFHAFLLGNEYGANFGNAVVDGCEINHTYDKSHQFCTNVAAQLADELHGGPQYFSPLFPLYEYSIAKRILPIVEYDPIISGCNQFDFAGKEPSRARYCGTCSKCAFLYLLHARFRGERRAIELFGQNLLANIELYAPLFDENVDKPLECIGTREEVRLLLGELGDAGFADEPVVQYFRNRFSDDQHTRFKIREIVTNIRSRNYLIPCEHRQIFLDALAELDREQRMVY